MATVELENLVKLYGDIAAVDDLTLDVREGEFLVLLGPSGCGKTTTLRMVSGFAEVSRGTIRIGGRDVTKEPPYRRNIGVVFQNYALFPHLTVFENVAFGLRRRRVGEAALRDRVAKALDRVKLGHLPERLPRQLSGGQQQRVAIARALVIEPDVLLLDEPLSNLDAKLRHDVRQEMRRLQQALGITTIMVTHDQDEAMSMGDRLVVMNGGRIQQIGTPQQLYRAPDNRFVAAFIGQGNFLEGVQSADGRFKAQSGLALACARSVAGAEVLMIRPEGIEILDRTVEEPNVFPAIVELVTYLGARTEIVLRLPSADILLAEHASDDQGGGDRSWQPGQGVFVRIDPGAAIGIRSDGPGPRKPL